MIQIQKFVLSLLYNVTNFWIITLAGLVATMVLSVLMLIKLGLGMMPQLNAIEMLSNPGVQYAMLPATAVTGWVLHFLIGTVLWGQLFAFTVNIWPSSGFTGKGVIFSVVASS